MNQIDRNNYEEWFFQYFEGMLSKEERVMVMEFISIDPLYQEEFETWTHTYVREPLPVKTELERILLKPAPSWKKPIYTGAAMVIISATLAFFYLNKSSEDLTIATTVFHPEKKSALKKTSKQLQDYNRSDKYTITVRKQNNNNTPKKLHLVPQIIETDSDSATSNYVHVRFDNLIEEHEVELKNILTLDTSVVAKYEINENTHTELKARELSKKEKRKYNQMKKWKDKQYRKVKAEQLRKGNQPYVVPVNPNF